MFKPSRPSIEPRQEPFGLGRGLAELLLWARVGRTALLVCWLLDRAQGRWSPGDALTIGPWWLNMAFYGYDFPRPPLTQKHKTSLVDPRTPEIDSDFFYTATSHWWRKSFLQRATVVMSSFCLNTFCLILPIVFCYLSPTKILTSSNTDPTLTNGWFVRWPWSATATCRWAWGDLAAAAGWRWSPAWRGRPEGDRLVRVSTPFWGHKRWKRRSDYSGLYTVKWCNFVKN